MTLEDVAAGIDHLGRLDEPLDSTHVVAIGHSAGGQLALWAAARPGLPSGAPGAGPSIRVSSAVAQAGLTDLREVARLGLSGAAAERFVGGPPGKYPQRYDLASPIERLPLGVPQLLVHGDADDVVPVEISRRYADRAAEAGDPCELVELPGVGHMEHLDPHTVAWRTVTSWLEKRCPIGPERSGWTQTTRSLRSATASRSTTPRRSTSTAIRSAGSRLQRAGV